jgi:hypothetical protein
MIRVIDNIPRDLLPNLEKSSHTNPFWEKMEIPKGGSISVEIPREWAEFFKAMLLSPLHFQWAKEFILSKASCLLGLEGLTVPLQVPDACKEATTLSCARLSNWSAITAEEEMTVEENFQSSPKTDSARRKGKEKEYLVETYVRRSTRLKVRNKGFKATSCQKVGCLGCSSKPPTLSTSAIRNLGKEFCQLDPELLSDDNLLKTKVSEPIGTKKSKGRNKKDKTQDDDKKDNPEA